MNKFDQLVDDLKTGRLTFNQLQIAMRASIRESEHTFPEYVDLLCGSGETNPGLIYMMFKPITQLAGAFELAVRRARDK